MSDLRENTPFYQELTKIVKAEQILFDEPMDRHTTFRVGGPASYFVQCSSDEETAALVKYLNLIDRDYYIVGNGSNLLVSDKGYEGLILCPHKYMTGITVEGNRITAQAGALLSQVAKAAADASLTGLEFAAGIPGTVGGAVVMNAGAYGGEMKQVLESVSAITKEGEIIKLVNDELMLGYRTSIFKSSQLFCTKAVFLLKQGDREEILAQMEDLKIQRKSKQPLEYPSAGSTFKRPEGHFAGKLIMDAGLRGFQVGGAKVSDKHCGFIINAGNATAADIRELIDRVIDRVEESQGVILEPEVCMLGEF